MADIRTKLEEVHRAVTEEEKEAVYRFRYDIYVRDLKREYSDADSGRQLLKDGDDDRDFSLLLYTGSLEEGITGTARVCVWPPGEVPEKNFARLSMQMFPGIENLHTAEVTRFMIRPDARGRFLLPSIVIHGYEYLAGESNTDIAFFQCKPSLVKHFRRLGTRPYGGALIEGGSSTMVPSVMVLSDEQHMQSCGSFLEPFVKNYFGPDKRPVLDTSAFHHLFEMEDMHVQLDEMRVWDNIQQELYTQEKSNSAFLDNLPMDLVRDIAKEGFTLSVKQGDVLTKENTRERSMYLVLSGDFEVISRGKRVAELFKGDLIGEISYFLGEGSRTATVRAISDGKVLILNDNFLKRLLRASPEGALKVLMNVCRIMAERMSDLLRKPN